LEILKIVIIGGGFSGAMTAYHLLRQEHVACAVTVVEPNELGLGLAYSTPCAEHLLNVCAGGMSALLDEPDHFFNYAKEKDPTVQITDFLPRKFFGKYVQELLSSAVSEKADFHSFDLVSQRAVDIEDVESRGLKVFLSNGQALEADIAVLALGNLAGGKPAWLDQLPMTNTHYIHNPWNKVAIDTIQKTDSVLLVGTGLTAVDKVIELTVGGHVGPILAASRHGLLPRRHLDIPDVHPQQVNLNGDRQWQNSALEALKYVRQLASQAAHWQAGVDSVRSITQKWWGNLALAEKRNFMRHLQTYWDVHRHRMAPWIANQIEATEKSGQLRILSGGIKRLCANDQSKIEVTIQERYLEPQTFLVDYVINCTGPQLKLKAIDSPLMANLHKRGLIAPDQTGAGINCEASGMIRDQQGQLNPRLFAIGPQLKAVLLESVAVPELKGQAQELARLVCNMQETATA
jgi:hydroxyacylglutathione hydrolase